MQKTPILLSLIFITCCIPISCSSELDGIQVGIHSYNYGALTIGDSTYFELELTNYSPEIRKIIKINFYSEREDEFWVEGTDSLISVSANGKKYLFMWFAPMLEGVRTAYVQVITDNEDVFNVKLSGTGKGTPGFNLPITEYDCGIGYVGHVRTHSFSIENDGTGNLVINSIDFAGPDSLEFFINSIIFPAEVKPKFTYPDDCTFNFTVNYKPIFTGISNATLTISYGSQDAIHSIELKGEAFAPAPAIEISSNDLNFGKVDVGNTAQHQFSVANTGVEDFSIYKLEIIPVNSGDFTINEVKKNTGSVLNAPYMTTLAGGESISVVVDFKPYVRGYTHLANLKVHHSLSVTSSVVSLHGDSGVSVIINECQTSDTPTGFGDWIELRNCGTSTVDISGWTIECWQGNNLEVTYKFHTGSMIDSYQHIVADDSQLVGINLPHFYIGYNLLWNRGGVYPGDYEVILRDNYGIAVDYVCFGNENVASADHIPFGITWNNNDYVNLAPGNQYIYRTSDENYYSSQNWATDFGPGTPLAKNPGQSN